jgi:outer membrane protein OmpA-like peptidoglycan-associated protein
MEQFAMSSSSDENTGVALGVVAGVVTLVVAGVVWFGAYQGGKHAPAKAPAAAAVVAPAAPAADADVASVKVDNGVVKFYFASAKADLATGANEALADVVKAVAAGKKAVISGFHDSTGDLAKNEELAKLRAFAVRDALKGLGIAEDKVEFKKPEAMTGSGSNAEARRVEVTVQ